MNSFAVAITKDQLTTQLSTDGHMGLVDEPVAIGGQNKGPTPYDLLCGALASCTSITLRLYANRKAWPVDRIRVQVNYSKVYQDDCETCEEGSKKLDHFERVIRVSGPLSTEQRQRLLEIANKCPVHQTLTANATVDTSMDG